MIEQHLINQSAAKAAAWETLMNSISRNLGPEVIEALRDPEVIEIMLNPDGALWVEKFGEPMRLISAITPEQADLAITLIASALNAPATRETPVIEGELPLDGSRFEGLIPPVVAAPTFTIRKKASRIFTFEDYVGAGILPPAARDLLEEAVLKRRNLLVAGSTGSGKTTFVNAVIEAVARLTPQDRLIVIEDTAELQSSSPNRVELHTTDFVDMQRLLKVTLRLRPDRIFGSCCMKTPLRRSLHRPALVLGGDRELVMLSGLGAFLTALGGFSLAAATCGLSFWLVALFWLRKWAKKDPLLRPVWLRHIRQRDFYPARTTVFFRENPASGPWKKRWLHA